MYNANATRFTLKKLYSFSFLLLLLFSSPLLSKAQEENLFNDPEKTKDFLDGRVYEVPNYGTLKFEFNKSVTRAMAEAHRRDQSDDEQVELVFDVIVKRNNSRKKDKGDYKVSIMIYLDDQSEINSDPNKAYILNFSIMRQIIYPLKGFPAYYTLFSDGDLYYWNWSYNKLPFKEYKSTILAGTNLRNEKKISYTKCSSISNK